MQCNQWQNNTTYPLTDLGEEITLNNDQCLEYLSHISLPFGLSLPKNHLLKTGERVDAIVSLRIHDNIKHYGFESQKIPDKPDKNNTNIGYFSNVLSWHIVIVENPKSWYVRRSEIYYPDGLLEQHQTQLISVYAINQ